MAEILSGEPSHHGTPEGTHKIFRESPEESAGRWYFSRKEIEENSPSRRDGIDLKKETYLRKAYCTFLQDLGMRLKVPQVTIATSIIFSHRFFLHQSHLTNDRRTIATACMFLAGKVEETPCLLKDVILVSYEIIHKKDPAALQRIKQQKDVYEKQKELVLLGERVVLGTLGYDLNINHPYKPLVEAIKRFKVAQNTLAQVAWNFVNDGLRTSLCLQFKPHHIAAGAIFLAAKFLKVKLPHEGEKIWWQEFDVNPHQLEEVSNQMLELYEQQNRGPRPQASEAEGSGGPPPSNCTPNEEHIVIASHSSSLNPANTQNGPPKISQTHNNISESEVNNIHESEQGDCNNTVETKEDKQHHGKNSSSPQDSNKKLDREKLKAAFERRKALGDISRKVDPMDELERELEDVEVPVETKPSSDFEAVEEGEFDPLDQSQSPGVRKRKPSTPMDRNGVGMHGYSEREHKRQLQENHV